MRPPRRRGLSALHLLFAVSCDITLVFFLVFPFFQDHGCGGGSYRARVEMDLEIMKKAVFLYDAREPLPLEGDSLRPLLGRYMQELPKDAWGRDYLFDGELGLIASFGRDGCPGGSGGEDTDLVVRVGVPDPGEVPRPTDELLQELALRDDLPCEGARPGPGESWLRARGPGS